ncbi:hypothetical protein cyc_04347 [Cyclospora cayetanensis]|uniref:Uncharacterized protein n=1 Tax=Cyclospora cayetanensis TaxID=88456 RepID=A0A1D3D1I2_9EIME|nr:hypothetical protein cyc_04347 [Cyclospora cayetanensis]
MARRATGEAPYRAGSLHFRDVDLQLSTKEVNAQRFRFGAPWELKPTYPSRRTRAEEGLSPVSVLWNCFIRQFERDLERPMLYFAHPLHAPAAQKLAAHHASRLCRRKAFAKLLRHYQENQLQLPLLTRHQQQHRRAPPPLLPQVRPWLGNRDLRWQQEELHELLLEERELLLQESQLMRPDSILAAYSYEHRAYMRGLPSQAAGKAVSEQGSDATAAAAETAASDVPAAAGPHCAFDGNEITCHASKDGCGARGPCRTSRTRKVTAISHHGAESCGKLHIDSYRAEIFARSELLTAQEVYAAVRCITDPEHPYTLEELLVVVPDYVKARVAPLVACILIRRARCLSCRPAVGASTPGPATLASLLHPRIAVLPFLAPRGSAVCCTCLLEVPLLLPQATLIGLLLLVKAQRAAAAVGATATSSVSVSIIPGAHASYLSINKQLGDKERVRAAAANPSLRQMIDSGKHGYAPCPPRSL